MYTYIYIYMYTHTFWHFVPQKKIGFLKHMKHDQSWNISGFQTLWMQRPLALCHLDVRHLELEMLPSKETCDFWSKNLSPCLVRKKNTPNIWQLKICGYQFGSIELVTILPYSILILFWYSQMYGQLSSGSKLYMLLSHLWIWVGCLLAIPCTPVVAQEKLGPKAKIFS